MEVYSKRQKRIFKQNDIDVEKVQRITQSIIESMQANGITIQESVLVINSLNCAMEKAQKCSSSTLLSKISIGKIG